MLIPPNPKGIGYPEHFFMKTQEQKTNTDEKEKQPGGWRKGVFNPLQMKQILDKVSQVSDYLADISASNDDQTKAIVTIYRDIGDMKDAINDIRAKLGLNKVKFKSPLIEMGLEKGDLRAKDRAIDVSNIKESILTPCEEPKNV